MWRYVLSPKLLDVKIYQVHTQYSYSNKKGDDCNQEQDDTFTVIEHC